MSKKSKFTIFILLSLILSLVFTLFFYGNDIPVLNPQGEIANKQKDLIIFASLLSLVVVIPVFTMAFFIVWKYRASNKKAKYTPDWDSNKVIESIWWGVPLILIAILSVVTWKSTHELDPFKPLESKTKPITIQVVALDWKWLFIYPEQDVATVNYVQFPVDTPVNFNITADAPMNAFWIPSLGGQMYAMAGMSTELNLMADKIGTYEGSSTNISGKGFAGMRFKANASSEKEFKQWIEAVKIAPNVLSQDEYDKLAKPSENNKVAYYSDTDEGLYNTIMMKFMGPEHKNHGGGTQ
ncbi:MAG TPA: ubiquinol oxidase subunit II [Patescibacteria group bacterium]|nr:ubiquinol oxidase subunit II [Patescibacteria group bacterium]